MRIPKGRAIDSTAGSLRYSSRPSEHFNGVVTEHR
jgi:hypothetical protein